MFCLKFLAKNKLSCSFKLIVFHQLWSMYVNALLVKDHREHTRSCLFEYFGLLNKCEYHNNKNYIYYYNNDNIIYVGQMSYETS